MRVGSSLPTDPLAACPLEKLKRRRVAFQVEKRDARQVVGNSAMWWRVGCDGYTCNLDEAWKVPGTWSGRDTDVLRPCAEVDALSERHFDVQKLREIK